MHGGSQAKVSNTSTVLKGHAGYCFFSKDQWFPGTLNAGADDFLQHTRMTGTWQAAGGGSGDAKRVIPQLAYS